MRIKAQVAMVMNLDKCIGCHTCSVTCKNTWTNRPGAEYMWFNNVETRPGAGYPRGWEDAEASHAGWELHRGRLRLKTGGAAARLATLFHNPDMPTIDDYYEPWTYDYETLIDSPPRRHQPVARARSLLTGEVMDAPSAGPNWDDDLAGGPEAAERDPSVRALEEEVRFAYEQAFLMYLPRICEHCLNPACVAACPSGAMYKRDEDGIVLVDQEACRGWRLCVSACPYKKVYFNWNTHKAEKCTFCYPRIEAGLPTICSETCVGRIRYLGVVLYDSDGVLEAASTPDPKDLYRRQLALFLDPSDEAVAREALAQGIAPTWLDAARRSPVYRLAVDWRVALPLHPEYRTLPMVWYVPPLSPIASHLASPTDGDGASLFAAIDAMRIPVAYLAQLLSAGDVGVVRAALRKLAAMRLCMRSRMVGDVEDAALAAALGEAGIDAATAEAMARLLGVAKYADRFVIPPADRSGESNLAYAQGTCSLEGLAPPEGVPPAQMRWVDRA